MRESVTTPPTPGAGRRISYRGPTVGSMNTGALPTMINITPRPGVSGGGGSVNSAYIFTQTGAPPSSLPVIRDGRCCIRLASGAGADNGFTLIPNFGGVNRPMAMPFNTVKGVCDLSGIDDYCCWEASVILAYDALTNNVTGDLGLVVAVGTASLIRQAPLFPGVELGPTGAGTMGVFSRAVNGGPVTFNQNVALPTDMTKFHRYAIRLIGPTATQEARMKFLVDGVVVQTLPFGAGTVLSTQDPFGTNMGFTPCIINRNATGGASTVNMFLVNDSFTVCSAPTELALL